MIINLDDYLSQSETADCDFIARNRKTEHVSDGNQGMLAATYSFGEAADMNVRDNVERYDDAFIGAIAECVASKFGKTIWTKESRQYKGNKRPDLTLIVNGKPTRCDCRGSRRWGTFKYRIRDDDTPDTLLIAVSNLPEGPDCKIGYAFFRELTPRVKDHEEWRGDHPGAKYYEVPFKFLHDDFSVFGNK